MNLPEPERKAMGQAGRSYIDEHYSFEKVVDRWENLYEELLIKRNLPLVYELIQSIP